MVITINLAKSRFDREKNDLKWKYDTMNMRGVKLWKIINLMKMIKMIKLQNF